MSKLQLKFQYIKKLVSTWMGDRFANTVGGSIPTRSKDFSTFYLSKQPEATLQFLLNTSFGQKPKSLPKKNSCIFSKYLDTFITTSNFSHFCRWPSEISASKVLLLHKGQHRNDHVPTQVPCIKMLITSPNQVGKWLQF